MLNNVNIICDQLSQNKDNIGNSKLNFLIFFQKFSIHVTVNIVVTFYLSKLHISTENAIELY